jgi:hypothetical protein
MQQPDPIDKLKMIYGLILLVSLVVLAGTFGFGRIEEKTSYGLMPIITTLSTLAGLFGGWAFREKRPDLPQPPPPPPEEDHAKEESHL